MQDFYYPILVIVEITVKPSSKCLEQVKCQVSRLPNDPLCELFIWVFSTAKYTKVHITLQALYHVEYLKNFSQLVYWMEGCCKSFTYIQAACVTAYKKQQLTTCFCYVQKKLAIWISECCCRRQWLYSIFKLINNFNKQEGIIMRYKPHLLLHCFLDIASCSWWPLFLR